MKSLTEGTELGSNQSLRCFVSQVETNVKLEECLTKVQQENEDYKARMDKHAALSKYVLLSLLCGLNSKDLYVRIDFIVIIMCVDVKLNVKILNSCKLNKGALPSYRFISHQTFALTHRL